MIKTFDYTLRNWSNVRFSPCILSMDITGDCRGDWQTTQEPDARHQKHGACLGKNTRMQICIVVQNLPVAQWWNEGSSLLRAYQDRVSLHRHEVQRRGARQARTPLATTGTATEDADGSQTPAGKRRGRDAGGWELSEEVKSENETTYYHNVVIMVIWSFVKIVF